MSKMYRVAAPWRRRASGSVGSDWRILAAFLDYHDARAYCERKRQTLPEGWPCWVFAPGQKIAPPAAEAA